VGKIFKTLKMSVSTENFLKTVYHLQCEAGVEAKPGIIASRLGISNAAATEMARKLAAKKLLHYKKYQPVELTEAGMKRALQVVRKHRLWELFLHQSLGLSLRQVHNEAEMLEHQTSDFLTEKLAEFLGQPTYDPHGDPIPDVSGHIEKSGKHLLLAKAAPGEHYRISRLYSTDEEILSFCEDHGLNMHASLTVVRQLENTKMTEIIIQDKVLVLNEAISNSIYVTE